MRRVWILLLALVLPLQTAWAAAHGYGHDADATAHVHVEAQATLDAVASADDAADSQAEAGGHGCCDMAHTCHGAATLMPTVLIQVGTDATNRLNALDSAFMLQLLVTRLDRPQWAPA